MLQFKKDHRYLYRYLITRVKKLISRRGERYEDQTLFASHLSQCNIYIFIASTRASRPRRRHFSSVHLFARHHALNVNAHAFRHAMNCSTDDLPNIAVIIVIVVTLKRLGEDVIPHPSAL